MSHGESILVFEALSLFSRKEECRASCPSPLAALVINAQQPVLLSSLHVCTILTEEKDSSVSPSVCSI